MNPRNPLPSLDLLKGFEVVARHLSFTRAAAELCVTQSAVSRQIRQLEEHLGVRLFERRTRAVVLTEVGYRYYTRLTPLLAQLSELTQTITATRTETRVRVTTTLSVASLWLVPRLTTFQERHPDVHVHVVADNEVRDLERDGFDLAIRYCLKGDAGDDAIRLFGERLTPVCSPALAARANSEASTISTASPSSTLTISKAARRGSRGISSFRRPIIRPVRGKGTVHFSHYDQAIRAARAGQGVALGRLPVIDASLKDGGLVAPLDAAGAVTLRDRAYWVVVPQARPSSGEVQLFVDWLREEARVSASAAAETPRVIRKRRT